MLSLCQHANPHDWNQTIRKWTAVPKIQGRRRGLYQFQHPLPVASPLGDPPKNLATASFVQLCRFLHSVYDRLPPFLPSRRRSALCSRMLAWMCSMPFARSFRGRASLRYVHSVSLLLFLHKASRGSFAHYFRQIVISILTVNVHGGGVLLNLFRAHSKLSQISF